VIVRHQRESASNHGFRQLVEAVHAQNTRAGSERTYHLVISLHPDDRRLGHGQLQPRGLEVEQPLAHLTPHAVAPGPWLSPLPRST